MKVAVVIRLSALGDVLLTAPAVSALAVTHRVVFVTDPAYAPLVGALSGVAEVRSLKKGIAEARNLGRELQQLQPELVIDLQNKVRTQVLARTIGAPVRTLARRTWGQSIAALAGRDTVLNDEHQSLRYRKVCAPDVDSPLTLGPLSLQPEWGAAADEAIRVAGWTTDDTIAVAPAATHATKGWPISRFIEVIQSTVPPETNLLLVAGPKDAEAVTEFRRALGERAKLLDASRLPLTTLAALLARCRVLLGNDSGPIHLATALGAPTLAIFGPTSVRRWGPLPGLEATHRVAQLPLACSPCSNHGGPQCPLGHHECMQKLSVSDVRRELTALLPSR